MDYWKAYSFWPIQVQIPLHLHCYSLLNIGYYVVIWSTDEVSLTVIPAEWKFMIKTKFKITYTDEN